MTTPAVSDQRAAAGDPLLVTLAGVAELAQVRRPVASMWRTRFASGDDAFPASVAQVHGADAFDVTEIADWLARTSHGNNPDARGDAAAAATPSGFSFADPGSVAELEALIALYARHGALSDLTVEQLQDAASQADPLDEVLRAEVDAHAERGAPWLGYTDRLVDAAYSPSGALALMNRRHTAILGSAGSAGRLTPDAVSLVIATTRALGGDHDTMVALDPRDPDLATALTTSLGDETTIALPPGADARRIRRRLTVDGVWLSDPSEAAASRTVTVARVPAGRVDSISAMLHAVDEVTLRLTDDDSAVVIGPARALVDALTPADERMRADVLRSGRVRGIARLAPGLVDSAPREALALWVLGAPAGEVAIADRFTVVADITTTPLTPAARGDLVSDLVASMGSAREVRAHAFRFARFASTASLLARGGTLVGPATSKGKPQVRTADLPVLLDAAADAVKDDIAPVPVVPAASAAPAPASVADLIHGGHLRLISGTRIDRDLFGPTGLIVVRPTDLDNPTTIGDPRIDQLAFAAQHPSASLTRPGDVIFRTSPTAAAWVDLDGSKVIAYPARVLRITAGDPGGLVPELIAADIASASGGPGSWKRWMLRRVAPNTIAPLRQALASIATARQGLEARAARLDHYATLIVAGATSGAVTMIDTTPAADAASTQ